MRHEIHRCDNCSAGAHIIFFHAALKKVVNFCWGCYDTAKNAGNVGHGS